MKVLYFAWIRERVGKAEEEIELPASVTTVADLVEWLSTQGEEYAHAFRNKSIVRVAIDRVHARSDAKITGAHEVALFPPMTGG